MVNLALLIFFVVDEIVNKQDQKHTQPSHGPSKVSINKWKLWEGLYSRYLSTGLYSRFDLKQNDN